MTQVERGPSQVSRAQQMADQTAEHSAVTLPSRLDEFVRASNALRSSVKAAEGFVSGMRIANLRAARQTHQKALLALADWAEGQARRELGYQQLDGGR